MVNWKIVEASGLGLIDVVSVHFHGGTEEVVQEPRPG